MMTGVAVAFVALAAASSPQARTCAIPDANAGGPRVEHSCYVSVYQTPWLGQARQTDVSLACLAGGLLAPTNVLRLRAKDAASVRWSWTTRDLLRIEYAADSRVRTKKSAVRFGDRMIRVELVPVDDKLPPGCDFEHDAVEIIVTQ